MHFNFECLWKIGPLNLDLLGEGGITWPTEFDLSLLVPTLKFKTQVLFIYTNCGAASFLVMNLIISVEIKVSAGYFWVVPANGLEIFRIRTHGYLCKGKGGEARSR